MKIGKIVIVLIATSLVSGCASSYISAKIGNQIGKSYEKTVTLGIPTAEQIHKAWPFISGNIKGLVAEDYRTLVVPAAIDLIAHLDTLGAKKELTLEEKGNIVGSTVRLEYLAGKYFYDRYGTSLYNLIMRIASGGAL